MCTYSDLNQIKEKETRHEVKSESAIKYTEDRKNKAQDRKRRAKLLNTEKGFLIVGGPHSGKTTFIRSFCMLQHNKNIVICDERNEIYSPLINHDFLINIPKASAVEQAVRTMNPDIIICDEIGNEREAAAILNAVNNGAAFICSVHACDLKSLYRKSYIKNLIDSRVFEKILFLKNHNGNFIIEDIIDV